MPEVLSSTLAWRRRLGFWGRCSLGEVTTALQVYFERPAFNTETGRNKKRRNNIS